MYSGEHARSRADQPAFIMAQAGEAITHAELEARSNRLAHFLRNVGLKRLDHYSIFMENNARYVERCAAGERAGLYYTCINSAYTDPQEMAKAARDSTVIKREFRCRAPSYRSRSGLPPSTPRYFSPSSL
jgi:long-chain acyl-CoA synthetase